MGRGGKGYEGKGYEVGELKRCKDEGKGGGKR